MERRKTRTNKLNFCKSFYIDNHCILQ
jgi:hypothetical protein